MPASINQLSASILREYDIRGIINETLNYIDGFYIGKAFASYVMTKCGGKKIVVARDGRFSSPGLTKQLILGIISTGAEVINIGIGPTPLLYFAEHSLNCDAGVMVTGSHNPIDHNGFKFTLQKRPFYGEQITYLGQLIADNNLITGKGNEIIYNHQTIVDSYIERLLHSSNLNNKCKVAWDPGNGAAGEIISELCKKLPGQHHVINAQIDGSFPNHHPDPSVEKNLEQLIETVLKYNCDFGVAFDGDGDRLGVVDSRGRILAGDMLVAIFASFMLKDMPGATIIADVKSSQSLFDLIAAQGGTAIMWKTGHSHIKSKMAETKAMLGGEMSGHIFFADRYYGYDDGIYAALRLLDILCNNDVSLSSLIDQLPITYSTKEHRIDCSDERKFLVIQEVKQRLINLGVMYNDIDGIRCDNLHGWWLMRASNTQAAIVVRCEATTPENLKQLVTELNQQLSLSNIETI